MGSSRSHTSELSMTRSRRRPRRRRIQLLQARLEFRGLFLLPWPARINNITGATAETLLLVGQAGVYSVSVEFKRILMEYVSLTSLPFLCLWGYEILKFVEGSRCNYLRPDRRGRPRKTAEVTQSYQVLTDSTSPSIASHQDTL